MKVFLIVGLLLVLATPLICEAQPKQAPKNILKKTVVSDPAYGKGGTLETYSDKLAKLHKEVWKDKDGRVWEIHDLDLYSASGEHGYEYERWKFTKRNIPDDPDLTVLYFPTGKVIEIIHGEKVTTIKDVDRSKMEDWINKFRKTFAVDGSITGPWDDTATTTTQPKLGSAETFKKPDVPAPKQGPKIATGHKIDPCLVGAWRSVLVFSEFSHWAKGGEDIVLMIEGDGQAAIDYTNTRPNVVGDNTRIWGGKSTGHLTSNNQTLTVTAETFGATVTFVSPGNAGAPRILRNGLGNLLQEINDTGAQATHHYTCDATTLTIKGTTWSSTWKRAGTTR